MMPSLVLLAACSSTVQRAGSLEGTWLATDGMTHRGLVVEKLDNPVGDTRHAFEFYLYEDGDAPKLVQSGLFSVYEGEVLYDVRWDENAFNIGLRFASDVERQGRRRILLQGREYERVRELPPGIERTYGFGDVVHVATGDATGHGLTVLDDGTLWGLTSFVGLESALGLGPDGEAYGPTRIETTLQQATFVSHEDFLGTLSAQAYVERRDPERVPAQGAGFDDTWTFDPTWTTPFQCFALTETHDAWVAACQNDGSLHPEANELVVWLDPEDGSVQRALPAMQPTRVWGLGDDVLVQSFGPSPAPEVHGLRGEEGWLLTRYGADGVQKAAWWSPYAMSVQDAIAVGPDLTVLSVATGADFPGATWTGGDASAQLLALDADGVRWARDLAAERLHPPVLAPMSEGFVLATPSRTLDLGLGTLAPSHGRGDVLAFATLDACGEAVRQVMWEDCTDGTCAGARVTTNPLAYPHDLAFDSEGRLVLQAGITGTFDAGGEPLGIGDGGSGFLARLGAPPPTLPCGESPFAALPPEVHVTITGTGEVAVGDQTCTSDCVLSVERFEELDIEATAPNGWQLTSVEGVCDSTPCTTWADAPVLELNVVFDQPDAVLIPSSGDIDRMAAGDTQVFAVGYFSASLVAEIDGQVVAPGGGQNAFLAVLDAGGLVSSVALDGTPVHVDLFADGDMAVVAYQDGTVRTFDASGLLSTTSASSGPLWREVARDPSGSTAVFGESVGQLNVSAADGSWTLDFPVTGSLNQALALVPRAAGGFTAVGYLGQGVTLPDGTVLTGGAGDFVLLHVNGDGTFADGAVMPYVGGIWGRLTSWEDAGELVFVTDQTRDPAAPTGSLFADHVGDDGSFLHTTAFDHVGVGLHPWNGGHVGWGALYSTTNPWGGPDLLHRGQDDLVIGWWDTGFLGAGAMGSAGSDASPSFPPPVAVLPDGTVFAQTAVDGGVTTPYAIGVFTAP